MKRCIPGLLIIFVSCFLVFSSKTTLGQSTSFISPSTRISDSLQLILDDETAAFGAVGAIAGIRVPGLWTWYGAYGNARISPSIPAASDFTFRIASLTKSFVATALLKLQELSVLDLDDNIGLYLDTVIFNTIPNGDSITIRHLLNHTSGISDYLYSFDFVTALLTQGLEHDFSPEELVAYSIGGSPLFFPGEDWYYSNTNYTLAALVIEGATGGEYESFISDSLLIPLGLLQTYFPTMSTLTGDYMGSYADTDSNGIKEDYSVISPTISFGAGALVSTLADILSWLESLENGEVLSEASLTEMKTYIYPSTSSVAYGLGLWESSNGNYTSIGHTGSIFNSSNMQHVTTGDFYLVFNVTDPNFSSYNYTLKLYNYLAPLLDSCRNFSPQLFPPSQTNIQVGDTIYLRAEAGNDYSYQWTLNGQKISDADSVVLPAYLAGDYGLEITDGLGCQYRTEEITLSMATRNSARLPLEINIFPNPAQAHVLLSGSWDRPYDLSLKLINQQGQVLIQRDFSKLQYIDAELSTAHLAKGLYFILLESERGITCQKLKVE